MWKKLLANKKMLILSVVVVLVFVGILIVALTRDDSGEDGKSGISIETGKDQNDDASEDDADGVYNGEGLEVEETLDESVYTIDGSGDWDGTSENGDNTNKATSDDKQSDDKQSDDTEKEESIRGNDADGELDNDILVDDKVWGEIN